ncbi:K+-sensing histidine kinase KdpD [Bacillus mesophilus]|uniref:Uncharacterized protein n=1 Tax=Bacillus mesophilus TaxID=1808955 RepID=A0A6M0Q8Y8_9BACI|nr:hypothetical protein [Bacillus mesophilus]MBM7661896.1 K+-sensing histidine kinase KdpD [Bacillus mesophilus]NEY72743.1 hypothetical protein [Bacillus mesophilus]
MSKSYDELLESFKTLWTNRRFDEFQDSLSLMKRIILTDLLDELAHPRIRSTPHKKFYQAVKRITQSNLSEEDQTQIIELYIEEMEKL